MKAEIRDGMAMNDDESTQQCYELKQKISLHTPKDIKKIIRDYCEQIHTIYMNLTTYLDEWTKSSKKTNYHKPRQ